MRIDYPRAGKHGLRRFVPSWRQTLALIGGWIVVIVGLFVAGYLLVDVPKPSDFSTSEATVIYYDDGSTQLGRIGALDRVSVPLKDVPVPVRDAVLAAEDRNFYSEGAVSPAGIARALWTDITHGSVVAGGSTITQQYVKNAYLTDKRTLTRKAKEFFISIKIGQERSKNHILEDYLNTIYFGRRAYGIQAAAQAYFRKDAKDLTWQEGAVLAASIRSPARYDPTDHPQRARDRWDYVLDGMVTMGDLTPAQRASATYPTDIAPSAPNTLAGPKGYIIAAVQQELEDHGFTEDEITRGGLRVITTLDPKAQAAALASVDNLVGGGKVPADVRTALVAVQPGTGKVLAMYGGADYTKRQFNDATQSIPPMGSTFKPYVLAAALSNGMSLDTTFNGRSPQTIKGAVIHNDSGEQFGDIDLVTATAHSVNTVFVQLGEAVGVHKVIDTAHAAGLPQSAKLSPNASMLLGSDSAHPIDQAAAYATFAAGGTYAQPYFVQEVRTPSGGVKYKAKAQTRLGLAGDVCADVTYALQQVIDHGTGTSAKIGRPAAGKTGTTSGNVSAWFVGYTPQISAAVTMFRDGNKPLQGIAGYSQIYGGTLPAKMWAAFMKGSLDGVKVEQFPPPAHVGVAASPSPSLAPSPTVSQPPSPTASPSPTSEPTVAPPKPSSPPDQRQPSPSPLPPPPKPSPPGKVGADQPAPTPEADGPARHASVRPGAPAG